METTSMGSRPISQRSDLHRWQAWGDMMNRTFWGRVVAAVVVIHLIVNVVLVPPVLTLLLTFIAAAWLTGATDRHGAMRHGALLGFILAITGVIVMGWFGFATLLWCGAMIGIGALGGQLSDRLAPFLRGGDNRGTTGPPAPASAAPDRQAKETAWVYAPGEPGGRQATWNATTSATPATATTTAPDLATPAPLAPSPDEEAAAPASVVIEEPTANKMSTDDSARRSDLT